MKKLILISILIFVIFTILPAKLVILEFNDGTSFRCEPLYCSDSLLYIWTGLDDFNINYIMDENNINLHAIRISTLTKINLRIPKSIGKSAKKAFTSTLLIGTAITVMNFRDQDIISIIGFNGIFNGIFGSILTLILDIGGKIPKNLDMTKQHRSDTNLKIIKNYCTLQNHTNYILIEKMMQEIQP